MAVDSSVAVPPPEAVKRQVAVRVEAKWDGPFDPVEFCRVGRSVQVTYLRSGQNTETIAAATVPATATAGR